ncbi:MAG: periplasmic heavy metal sensor [Rhodobacteraceae bacterium]|nr:periplasmic heavy metal sensor [Paracoccaceae bacterium]MBR9822336.1 periplasmic heavy metal sensor [Paracoccaceae bacterium]
MSDPKAPDHDPREDSGGDLRQVTGRTAGETPLQGAAPGEGSRPRARRGMGLRVLLFGSLALNLAVAGLVVGVLTRTPIKGPPRPDHVAGALTFALSPEDRRAIGREVFREMRQTGAGRPDRRAEYARVLAALRADPFQPEELRQVFAHQRDTALRFQQAGQKALMAHLMAMTPEQRLAFADRLEEGLERQRDRPPRGTGSHPPAPRE